MMKIKLFLYILMLLIICQCEMTKNPGYVYLNQTNNGIKINNQTQDTIAYFPMEENVMALIDWNGPICHWTQKLDPFDDVIVDSSNVLGWAKGKNNGIYYWNCPGEVDMDDMKSKFILIK
ncbi:MAG: hypothetical protein JXQ65_05475 [Candidatus Marinimicrobia bacterium]|nr:hypothetical protein [Candidatus Neomarinimicrobiota bacterium]